MPLVSMRQLLDEAAKGGYGVGAFNVNDMEQIQAIMEAATETQSPVIVQASRGARAYSQDRFLYHLMIAATEIYPEIPIVLHQDHGNSVATCKSAIDMGFTSVMMDGSLMEDGKTPSSFEYNVKVTREVVELAHAKGVTVEGEIGCLGGIEDGHGAGGSGLEHLTDPDQAVEFVKQTGVDALAIAIGTSHGAYKFSSKPTGETLKMAAPDRDPQQAAERPPGDARFFERPQGSAGHHQSVRRQAEAHVGRAGGRDPARHPQRRAQDQRGYRQPPGDDGRDPQGVRGEAGRVRSARYMKPAREAMKKVVALRMTQFGQAGHSKDYKPIPMAEMAATYKKEAVTV